MYACCKSDHDETGGKPTGHRVAAAVHTHCMCIATAHYVFQSVPVFADQCSYLLHHLLNQHWQKIGQHLAMPIQCWAGIHFYQVYLHRMDVQVTAICLRRHTSGYCINRPAIMQNDTPISANHPCRATDWTPPKVFACVELWVVS